MQLNYDASTQQGQESADKVDEAESVDSVGDTTMSDPTTHAEHSLSTDEDTDVPTSKSKPKWDTPSFCQTKFGLVGPTITSEEQRKVIALYIKQHPEMEFAAMYLLELEDVSEVED